MKNTNLTNIFETSSWTSEERGDTLLLSYTQKGLPFLGWLYIDDIKNIARSVLAQFEGTKVASATLGSNRFQVTLDTNKITVRINNTPKKKKLRK